MKLHLPRNTNKRFTMFNAYCPIILRYVPFIAPQGNPRVKLQRFNGGRFIVNSANEVNSNDNASPMSLHGNHLCSFRNRPT